jgi:hypothetical protein
MRYTLKDVVGATLTDYFSNLGMLVLLFDNGRVLRVWPLHKSQKGLVVYPQPAQFVGQKIVNVGFEMSTKEGFYGWSENVDTNEIHHRRLTLDTEHRGLHIESVSFDVPPEFQCGRCYSVC